MGDLKYTVGSYLFFCLTKWFIILFTTGDDLFLALEREQDIYC